MEDPTPQSAPGRINCLLCGGTQIYPGPRYQNHLINEHGAVNDVEFLIQITVFKKDNNNTLPDLNALSKKNKESEINQNDNESDQVVKKVDTSEKEVQTDEQEEQQVTAMYNNNGHNLNDYYDEDDEDQYDSSYEVTDRLVMDMEEEDEEIDLDGQGQVNVWICPFCDNVFKRHSHFKTHVCTAHDMSQADIDSITPVSMTEEEFLKRKQAAEMDNEDEENSNNSNDKGNYNNFVVDKAKRKPVGKEWGPNSFSSTFTCYFCNEQFRKDYRLKLHLMLNHKNESSEEMAKAKEVLTKAKLDGCVHKCALCGSKYNSVANFTRHIKDVHQITRAQYRVEYGSSEVVSRMFKCELCDKEVKHTRNIIGAHMKMVHLISWKEYQEILIKIRQGETVGDLPAPELFECIICGVSVKYKREHLNKKHQITEDVYDELIAKKSRGEDISDVLPEREIYKCLICERECMDIKKHIERSHQITEEMYEEMVASKAGEAKRSVKQMSSEDFKPSQTKLPSQPQQSQQPRQSFEMLPAVDSESSGTASPNIFNNSQANFGPVSTDLQCYFGCDESFKKDYQLHLHLKLKHRNEDPEELAKAYEAAEEEIALTRRSASIFNCALCPKTFNDNGAFYGHIQTKHNMAWKDYKDKYGRCEVESAPFECKICGRVVKYDRNTVHTHLKNVHGINWAMYLDRIRRMRRGEIPEDLPAAQTHECRVCNVSVKYLKEHLKNAHKITEQEYESLFENDDQNGQFDMKSQAIAPQATMPKPPPLTPKPQLASKIPRQPTPEVMLPLVQAHDPTLPKPPKSDIQDKTNKTCSSCTITFDSRRSFIEHCTTVHNMRFKTKSGVTISNNTVQKRLQEEALKRSKEAEEQQQQQVPVIKQPLEDDSVIGASGKRTLYTPSGVSKWNQCRYECCFCKRSTMSRSSMTSHIHNTHGLPIKDYKEANYPDIEVETNWFQCRLCPARTKFVKDCIAPHLKMSHNMDIEVYERDIMQPEDWPYEVIPEPSLRHEMRKEKSNAGVSAQDKSHHQHQSVPKPLPPLPRQSQNEQSNSERDKWNRCKFACGLCELVTVDSRQMRLHIATHHGMSMDAYTKQYGTTEIVTKKFRCELCNSEMKFCRQNIYAHMKDVHKITLQDYEAQIGMYAIDILPVEDMPGGVAAKAPVRRNRHTPVKNKILQQQLQQPLSNNDEEIVVEGIDPTLVLHQDDYVDSGLLDDGKKPSRWNKCRFRCAICGKLSSEKRHVREHIIKVHGLNLPDYEAQYGDCEIHTEYFFCGVCHAEVKHNLKNISLHLQNVHAMSPAQYEQQYGMIPEDEAEIEPMEPLIQPQVDYGFGGGHFLLDDNNVETYDNPLDNTTKQPIMIVDAPKPKALPNPPKDDILNPKNKHCHPCNREFNRRQAFVEHCRTVHGMKIRFAKASSGTTIINSKAFTAPAVPVSPKAASSTPVSPATGYPCQYCGKLFSNQSNRRRHAVLSCDLARSAGVEPRKSRESFEKRGSSSLNNSSAKISEEDYYADEPVTKEPQKCPFPECDFSSMRNALMKRHLYEAHDVSSNDNVDSSPPRKKIKIEQPDDPHVEQFEQNDPLEDGGSGDDRKVPPLRVKISQVVSQHQNNSTSTSPAKEPKPFVCCPICNEFKSNNLYILGRHQKSCEKKFKVNEEDMPEHDNDLEEHDTVLKENEEEEPLENEGDEDEAEATIEVPVDFEENDSNEVTDDQEVFDTEQQLVVQDDPEANGQDYEDDDMEPPEPITEMMEIAQEESEDTANEEEASEPNDNEADDNNASNESNQE